MNKRELRTLMKTRRSLLTKDFTDEVGRQICREIIKSPLYKNAEFIAAYLALGNEVDLGAVINRAFADGKRVCVPVTEGKEMYFSEVYREDVYDFGNFGIREPKIKRKTDGADLILVPGLAFMRDGSRLGWGGGYYDRMRNNGAVRIGVCYDFQIRDDIKTEPHDKGVDYVVSERGMIYCE